MARRKKQTDYVFFIRAPRFDYAWLIGNSGSNYGYDSPAGGGYGGLTPNSHQGIEIVQFIVTTADVVVLATEASAPLYGDSSIRVSVEGAPSQSYQIDPIGPGLGFYQTSIPELAQYVISRNGATLRFNIEEATG